MGKIKLKEMIQQDPNLRSDIEENVGNFKLHKFKNLYNYIGHDIDLTAYDNKGKIVGGGIDKETFKAKSFDDIINKAVKFFKISPKSTNIVDISDRESGESLAAVRKAYSPNESVELTENSNYTSEAIRNFIADNDNSSPYNPTIKLHGPQTDTKWLSIDWDTVLKIMNILQDEGK